MQKGFIFALTIGLSGLVRAQTAPSILQEFDSKLSISDTERLKKQSAKEMIPRELSAKWHAFLKTQGSKASAIKKSKRKMNASDRARKKYLRRLKVCKPKLRSNAWVYRAQKKFPREFLDQHQRQFRRMIFYLAREREKECVGDSYEDLLEAHDEWLSNQMDEQELYEKFFRSLQPKERKKYSEALQTLERRRQFIKSLKGKPPIPVYHGDNQFLPSEREVQKYPKEIREFCEKEKAFKTPFDSVAAVQSFQEIALAPPVDPSADY